MIGVAAIDEIESRLGVRTFLERDVEIAGPTENLGLLGSSGHARSLLPYPAHTPSRAIIAESIPLLRRALIDIFREDLRFSEVDDVENVGSICDTLESDPSGLLLIDSFLLGKPNKRTLMRLATIAQDCMIIVFADERGLPHAFDWVAQGASAVLDKRLNKQSFCKRFANPLGNRA